MTKFTDMQWDALLEMMKAFARAAAWRATGNDREYEDEMRADALAADYKALFVEEAMVEEPVSAAQHWKAVEHPERAYGYAVQAPNGSYWPRNDGAARFYSTRKAAKRVAKELNGS